MITAAAVHSMAGGCAAPDWPALNAAEVRTVLRALGLSTRGLVLRWISPRPLSAAALVSADGHGAIALGEWTYEVHEQGEGKDVYRRMVSWAPFRHREHAVAAGRALARLHCGARGYGAPARSARILVSNDAIIGSTDPTSAMEQRIAGSTALRACFGRGTWRQAVQQAWLPWHGAYRDLHPQLERLWTHNDWHSSNLLWSNAGRDADLAAALLRGYLAERPLAPLERRAVLAVLPIVHVGYALAEVEYFHGITRSAANAELAFKAFLLGHCQWFDAPQGHDFLRSLQAQLGAPT